MEKTLFIINPISGGKNNKKLSEFIKKISKQNKVEAKIFYTDFQGHAYQIAQDNLLNYNKIIAVGGDGTINEISKALINTNVILGIIPTGSGNGLARTLKIPMNYKKAVKRIIEGEIIKIDSGIINDHHFINVAGIGFDAEIAHMFEKSEQRGLKTYIWNVIKKFIHYKTSKILIKTNGEEIKSSPFLLSIANSTQWGNNAHISPGSDLTDGFFEICILNKFPLIYSPILALKLFLKTIHKSKYMKIIKADSATVNLENQCKGHVDGEPVFFDKTLTINVLKNSINVVV